MNRDLLIKYSIIALSFAGGVNIYAQQTMVESNLLKHALDVYAQDAILIDVPALSDGNDATVSKIEATENMPAIIVKFGSPLRVGTINFVAGEDVKMTPRQVYVYVRNTDEEEWKAERRINAISFSLPFVNFASPVTSKAYKQYKIEIRSTGNGENTVELAELQLLGENPTKNIIGGSSDLSLDKNYFDNGVIGENAWYAYAQYDFEEPTSITGYSIGTGSNSGKNNRPRVWELSGSDDGETWVTLDMRSNQPQLSGENYSTDYYFGQSDIDINFGEVADEIYSIVSKNFTKSWGSGSYLINSWSSDPEKVNNAYNYWWMAHAIDAYVDAYARTRKNSFETAARLIRMGMYTAYNAGRQDLFNDYNDDMEWMCIACCNAYRNFTIDRNKWLEEAKQLFDWVWQSRDETTGGILWTVNSQRGVLSSKNSCSNAPAMICANYLYELTGDEEYLNKSKMIFEFMYEHNLFDDGFVKDGPENENRGWAFTYNQGTWVGGLLGLYKATGDQKYYDIATDLMDKSIESRWYSPNGILCESGKGDGGLFKGIYVRYITEWVLSGLLDQQREMRYANYLLENARSLYLSALLKPDNTIMANWQDRGEAYLDTYDASVVLSGLFLLEGVDKMRRAGILNDNYTMNNPSHSAPFSHYRIKVTANYGGNNVEIKSFSLLGDSPDSAVAESSVPSADDEGWYTTGALRIPEPTHPGLYIHKGKLISR